MNCMARVEDTPIRCMLPEGHEGDHVKHLRWARKRNEIAGLEKLCRQEAENGIARAPRAPSSQDTADTAGTAVGGMADAARHAQ